MNLTSTEWTYLTAVYSLSDVLHKPEIHKILCIEWNKPVMTSDVTVGKFEVIKGAECETTNWLMGLVWDYWLTD